MFRDPEYGPEFVAEFQDRLLFGTNICSFEMPFSVIDLLLEWRDTKTISDSVFSRIARENAVKLLSLE